MEYPLTCAMMADAGDEAIILQRQLDKDDYSISKIFVWVQTFLNRIRALFYDQMCLCSGYTQVMLTHLKASLCVVVDGQPWQCGHPDTDALPNPLVKRCLGRLEAWVKDRQKFHHHTHNHHNHQFGAHRPLPTLFVQLWFCFSPNKACT